MSFPKAPLTWNDIKEHLLKLATVVNSILDGKINSTGTVTLTANTTTTTVSDVRAGPNSAIDLMPQTANAAAEACYIATQSTGSFTITHSNDTSTDRTYRYSLLG